MVMVMMKPPVDFLIHSIEYVERIGEDDWQKPIYSDPVTINNVRVDMGSQYSTTGTGKQLLYNGLIFIYNGRSSPMVDFKEESKVRFNGTEMTITSVIPVYEAYVNELYSIELEVI